MRKDAGSLRLAVLFAVLLLVACHTDLPEPTSAQRVRSPCPDQNSDSYYFPEGTLIPSSERRDLAQRQGVGKFLTAMGAPSLSCNDDFTEAYRFLWLHSFGPALVVSVMRQNGRWHAEGVEFRYPRSERRWWWTIERRVQTEVLPADAGRLLEALKSAQLWTTHPPWRDSSGEDGSLWMIEGRLNRGYRAVSRANPTDKFDKAFKEAARTFVQVAKLSVPPFGEQLR